MIVQEFIHQIGTDTAALLGAALAGFTGYYLSKGLEAWKRHKRNRSNAIPSLIKKDIGVYRDLTELLFQTKADRAFVMQFHNGTYYVNQGGQMKMSCTHEIVREGISREQEKMQDLLISRYASTVNDVISNPSIIIAVDVNNYYFAQMLRNQGVVKSTLAVLRNENMIEGFIGVSYVGEAEESTKDKEVGRLAEDYAGKIGYTLRKDHE